MYLGSLKELGMDPTI
ncbi:hypothetical protein PVK04_23205, partial [Salmonella enterica subsp. enterica serovar Typhi]|nr:hypothetical protein [Salmonella enterica subsp. enterica serovar Typhi]